MVAERLAVLYADVVSLRRLLALARVDAGRIPFDGRASNMAWFAAVEAARQGRLLALVGVMLEEYASDPWLVAIYGTLAREQHEQNGHSTLPRAALHDAGEPASGMASGNRGGGW
jgi:hypothetical protein